MYGFLPIIAITFLMAPVLIRFGWRNLSIVWPCALGMGPLLAAWETEVYLRLSPGADQAGELALAFALTAIGMALVGWPVLRQGIRLWSGLGLVVSVVFVLIGIAIWIWSG